MDEVYTLNFVNLDYDDDEPCLVLWERVSRVICADNDKKWKRRCSVWKFFCQNGKEFNYVKYIKRTLYK